MKGQEDRNSEVKEELIVGIALLLPFLDKSNKGKRGETQMSKRALAAKALGFSLSVQEWWSSQKWQRE